MGRGIDLYAEFGAALLGTPLDDAGHLGRWFAARGLAARKRHQVGGVGITRAILFRSTGTYEPSEDGERVMVAPVWAGPAAEPNCPMLHLSDLIDLAVWRPAEPQSLFLRVGIATVVGCEGLRLSRDTAAPLRLHRTFEGFIRYGGESLGDQPAAVLINPAMAWFHLFDLSAVICDDLAHAEELEEALAAGRPPLPPIRVPLSALGTAA